MPSGTPTAEANRTPAFPARHPWAVLLCLAVLWAVPVAAVTQPTLDFLYIDSTVDEAAGGHTAVRLGENVFHYQYYENGLFLLINDPWERFRRLYNDLQNRSFTVTRVPLSREAFNGIRSHFVSSYVLQEHRLLILDQLSEQQALLERLAGGEDTLALEGLGLFSETSGGDPDALALRHLVAQRLGEDWLETTLASVRSELESTSFSGEAVPAPAAEPPARAAGSGVRARELLALREALTLLREARGLADDALLVATGNGGPLTPRERAAVEDLRRQTAESVLSLAATAPPDAGRALTLQMARFQALSRSLATGVLATLDPFADAAPRADPASAGPDNGTGEPAPGPWGELVALRQVFVDSVSLRPALYGRLEAAQGRLAEQERAERLGVPARSEEGPLQPRRRRAVETGLRGSAEEFAAAARRAARERERSQKHVERTYRYNLFTRNCVTELVRAVNDSFKSRELAQEQLGGTLEPGEKFSFVPFRLTAAVRGAFPSAETEYLPSYRLRQLDRLYERGGPLLWLRENNTLTSTLYEPAWAEDSVFLFFTDDVVAPRPLLGTLNLLYATVHAAGGLLLAPVDRGKLLTQSLRGMLYSLPEIAFFNIRKGSFPVAPYAPGGQP